MSGKSSTTRITPAAMRYSQFSSAADSLWAPALALVLLAGRLFELTRYRIDSDEPQHLHVAWAWTHHLLPYRDVFDNHMPLFQLLSTPFVILFGEHDWTLLAMRVLMLPLYLLTAWCTYRLGTIAFSRQVGVWSALLLSAIPPYFLCSIEYRTDNLWLLLWVICLLVVLGGPFTSRRALAGGLLLGLCFAVSMKSLLLLIALSYASLTTAILIGRVPGMPRRRLAANLVVFSVCAVGVPSVIAAVFALGGLWPEFYYGVIGHNLLPRRESGELRILRVALYLLALIGSALAAARLRQVAEAHELQLLPIWIGLLWGAYLFSLLAIWTMLTRQDFFPTYPLAAVLVSAAAWKADELLRRRIKAARWSLPVPLPAAICTCGILLTMVRSGFGTNGARVDLALVRDALRITQPADFVVDAKGETVFRQRAPFFVYESITIARIRTGQLKDDLASRAIAAHACFASTLMEKRLSPESSAFLQRNYLSVSDNVRVAGCMIGAQGEFETVIPAEYEIVAPDGPVTGKLDNKRYDGPCFIQQGQHRFMPAQSHKALAVVWENAIRAHFSPFCSRLRESRP